MAGAENATSGPTLVDESPARLVKVSLILTDNPDLLYAYRPSVPAVKLAVQEATRRYAGVGFKFELSERNASERCATTQAGAIAAEEFYLRGTSLFLGPGCPLALDHVARMTSYWNVPHFTTGGMDLTFANKRVYSTLSRFGYSSLDKVANFLVEILREFDWHHIALLVSANSTFHAEMGSAIEKVFRCRQLEWSADPTNETLLGHDIQVTRINVYETLFNRVPQELRFASTRARG